MNNKPDNNDNIKLETDQFQSNSIIEMPEIHLYYAPSTKFSIPYTGTLLVSRKDIDSRLTEAVKKKLTIITAPAGYGKSTIVGSWALRNKANKNITWITLDKEDSEESGFWHNVLYAINYVADIVPYHRILSFSSEQCINLIINYFSGNSLDNFIIFDDFHNIDCDIIHKSFEYFLAYLPGNLHCILMSRTFPSLPISKMVVNDDVTLFGVKDLRFSHEEAGSFLKEVMNLKLSEEEVRSLEIKTEGWVAAIKVAALSLRNCSDKSTFINSFDNSNNKMFQYMLEEVINFLETPIKEFLMKTSILKSLNKSICDALTGSNNSEEILGILETNGFFIISLDDKQENYRYHHLLSEIMIKLLGKVYPDEVKELYLAASRWYEDRGYYQDALEYSHGAKDHRNTLRLLEKYYSAGHPDILGPKSICGFFETIPCDMYDKMPDLCIRYAFALTKTGQVSTDEKELIKRGIHLDSDVFKSYEGQVSQLRAYIALKHENIVEIVRYSEIALQQLPETDISGVTPCLILGYIYRSLGDLKKAEAYFSNALVISNRVNALWPGEASESFILSNFYMTSILYLKGESDDFIKPLNQLLNENITHKNCMYFCLAATYYDYDDLQEAYRYVMKGLELCNTYDDIFYEKVRGFVLLARILLHTGKSAEALHVMNEIDCLVKPDCGNLFILLELPGIVSILVSLGLLERAQAYIHKFRDINFKEAKFMISEAESELFLAKNDYKQAIDRLEAILLNMDIYPKKRMDLLIQTSAAYAAYGKSEDALAFLQKALETKGAERNIRAFVDRGKPIHELLIKLISMAKKSHDHNLPIIAEKLVKRFENKSEAVLKAHPFQEFERLSGRELEVLRLLMQGFSYEEIGKALFISLSTVKKHTGNIYDKLKAGNRIQAVNIAKANGLVD